jgi:hypothetical protein
MPGIFPARAKISPSFTEPDIILTYSQASGAFASLAGGKPRVKIGSEDLAVYIHALDFRTDVASGQSATNLLPSAILVPTFFSTPTYVARTRAIYDHHDIAQGAHWAVAVPAAFDLGARQGMFQQLRTSLLYGYNPAKGEGLMNTAGATAVNLPADPFGNTTVLTYDNGAMALFWLSQIVALKTGMFQSGANIKNKIVVISPQRVWLQLAYANIVQVTSYQRPGAGTATTGEVVKTVAGESGDQFDWYFDDTLIGAGANGNDAVILTMPEIEAPTMAGINTNIFGGEFQPQMRDANVMYMDMAAPMKIPTPTPDGAITEIHEMRFTSGWNVRPQALRIVSMQYQ